MGWLWTICSGVIKHREFVRINGHWKKSENHRTEWVILQKTHAWLPQGKTRIMAILYQIISTFISSVVNGGSEGAFSASIFPTKKTENQLKLQIKLSFPTTTQWQVQLWTTGFISIISYIWLRVSPRLWLVFVFLCCIIIYTYLYACYPGIYDHSCWY